MSYGNGYGNNRGGSYNRGGGGNNNSGGNGYGNKGQYQPKDGTIYINPEDNPKSANSPHYWGEGIFEGKKIRIAMWNGKKPNSFKIAISPKQGQGAQQGRQGYGNQGGGYQHQQQPQQQQHQGMYDDGPDLNDEVPF